MRILVIGGGGGGSAGTGVLGPEAFDAVRFLDLLTAYGSPWGQLEVAR